MMPLTFRVSHTTSVKLVWRNSHRLTQTYLLEDTKSCQSDNKDQPLITTENENPKTLNAERLVCLFVSEVTYARFEHAGLMSQRMFLRGQQSWKKFPVY